LTGKTVVIAVQTRAEVLSGLFALGEARRSAIRTQLDNTPTIPIDEEVILRFAKLTADARGRGDALAEKIHTGDRWIAATALAINAPLLAIDRIYQNDPDLRLLDR
jgi:predicted nucleic acid-binding protein